MSDDHKPNPKENNQLDQKQLVNYQLYKINCVNINFAVCIVI